jgi:anti-sigma-K factor RskA
MSPQTTPLTDFERNARTVLEESVRRIDARTRSRLNQARHAALEAATAPRVARWRSFTLMPAAGAAAAVLVAFMLWQRHPGAELPMLEAPHSVAEHAGVEDLDLLADGEAMELMEGGDGSFYEWAVSQADAGGESNG